MSNGTRRPAIVHQPHGDRSDRLHRARLVEANIAREVQVWMVGHRNEGQLPEVIPADPGHVVYVARSIFGDVLYVGVTSNLYRRLAAHQSATSWWGDVHTIAIHAAKTRRAAARLEATSIVALQPRYNVNGRTEKRRPIR